MANTRIKHNRVGRPTIISDELVEEFCTHLEKGIYLETACALVGIQRKTLYEWLKRGARAERKADTTGEEIVPEEMPYVVFTHAIKAAMAESEVHDLMNIGRASANQWQASAWRLERRYPKRYAMRRYEHQVSEGGATLESLDLSQLSPEERATLRTILEKTKPK